MITCPNILLVKSFGIMPAVSGGALLTLKNLPMKEVSFCRALTRVVFPEPELPVTKILTNGHMGNHDFSDFISRYALVLMLQPLLSRYCTTSNGHFGEQNKEEYPFYPTSLCTLDHSASQR